MLQETLGKGEEIVALLSKLMPGWLFQALDADGRSGGLVTGYRVGNLREISAWGFDHTLALELYSKELCLPLLLLNVYGPCQEREMFWSSFFQKYFLNHQNLIIGGDLNFSLGVSESWGANARANPLT